MMKALVIIPARYESTRFPGKPLALINGKPMVQHVYERCKKAFENVVVATDDERISNAVKQFGGKFVMTLKSHQSGTDRCAEAALKLQNEINFDIVVNVQGDEPFIDQEQLQLLLSCFHNPETQIATLVCPISETNILFDTNKVKAVCDKNGFAAYFSRQPIPFMRDIPESEWVKMHRYFVHLGLYAFKAEVLQQVSKLAPSSLELAEKLEQLRWLENGYRIQVALTTHASPGVDTPDDLERLLKL